MLGEPRSHCPIAYALDVFGDRWTLLIIRDLMLKGRRHFSEFLNGGEGIASNVLADRLARLSAEDVVSVHANPDDSRSKIYSLTNKGLDLAPLLLEIILWSAKHDPDTATDKAFVARARRDRAGLLASIRAANRIPRRRESVPAA